MSADDDVAEIEIRSGVNDAGEGFNTVVVTTGSGRLLLGQLDPETVRSMALDWLGAAEAAETDGIVFSLLVETLSLPKATAAGFVLAIREHRP